MVAETAYPKLNGNFLQQDQGVTVPNAELKNLMGAEQSPGLSMLTDLASAVGKFLGLAPMENGKVAEAIQSNTRRGDMIAMAQQPAENGKNMNAPASPKGTSSPASQIT